MRGGLRQLTLRLDQTVLSQSGIQAASASETQQTACAQSVTQPSQMLPPSAHGVWVRPLQDKTTRGNASSLDAEPSQSRGGAFRATAVGDRVEDGEAGSWAKCLRCDTGCVTHTDPPASEANECRPCTGCSHIFYAVNGSVSFLDTEYIVRDMASPRFLNTRERRRRRSALCVYTRGAILPQSCCLVGSHVGVLNLKAALWKPPMWPARLPRALEAKGAPRVASVPADATWRGLGGSQWEAGASAAHILRVQVGGSQQPLDPFVKFPCVPSTPKHQSRDCNVDLLNKTSATLAALQRLSEECGLDDVAVRAHISPVRSSMPYQPPHPGQVELPGGGKVNQFGLFTEAAPGISLSNLVSKSKVNIHLLGKVKPEQVSETNCVCERHAPPRCFTPP